MRFLLLIYFVHSIAYGDIAEGESIYLRGIANDGQVIQGTVNGLKLQSALPCVNCHRESGLGTSESGKTIPPVSWGLLTKKSKRGTADRFRSLYKQRTPYTPDLVHRILNSGINSNGRLASELMPRYALSKNQTNSIIEYLQTLHIKNDPGVNSDELIIATIIDTRLPLALREQHVEFLTNLFRLKNSLTRGELKRKKFAPIQKIPQYESYKRWKLVVWELNENPLEWNDFLTNKNNEQPSFAVLSPLIKDNANEVALFCNQQKLPCLFYQGSNGFTGDNYSFVYRDIEKQKKDYLSKKIRKNKGGIYYFKDDGQLSVLKSKEINLPNLGNVSRSALQQSYNSICGRDLTLIVNGNTDFLQQFLNLNCPVQLKLAIFIMADYSVFNFNSIKQNIVKSTVFNMQSQICWVTDYRKMLNKNTRKIRADVLVRKFKMKNVDTESLLLDLYAFGLLSDAVYQLAGNFSRLYLLEILEHMLNSYPNVTYFDVVAGAPHQRSIVGALSEYCPSKE